MNKELILEHLMFCSIYLDRMEDLIHISTTPVEILRLHCSNAMSDLLKINNLLGDNKIGQKKQWIEDITEVKE